MVNNQNMMFPNMMNNQNVMNNQNMMNNQNILNNQNMMNLQNMMNYQNMMNNQMTLNNQNIMNYQNQITEQNNMMNNNIMNPNQNLINEENIDNQMKNNDQNDRLNEIKDPLYYIDETKKIIKFINSENQNFNVKIPISLTKNDLYSIANNYKFLPFSKFILSYNNCMLERDDSSIEEISNGGIINIIEERKVKYFKFKECEDSNKKVYVTIKEIKADGYDIKKNFFLSEDTTISELMDGIYSLLGTNKNCIRICYFGNGMSLKESNERIKSICQNNILPLTIVKYGENKPREVYGKPITLKVYFKYLDKKNKIEIPNTDICTGTLESIVSCFNSIEMSCPLKIKKLIYNEKELKFEEEKSLLSLGIKNSGTIIALVSENNIN